MLIDKIINEIALEKKNRAAKMALERILIADLESNIKPLLREEKTDLGRWYFGQNFARPVSKAKFIDIIMEMHTFGEGRRRASSRKTLAI